ncbi:MAG: hypothetical protein HN553_00065 [Opitutae bacterium]|nr:hypothetical protein [Opitutae bacterium]
MDSISQSESGKVLSHYSNPVKPTGKSVANPENGTSVSLTDLSSLATKAQSGSELRADVIEKAKLLLADPNWPNDEQLENLSEKLLSTEDFN